MRTCWASAVGYVDTTVGGIRVLAIPEDADMEAANQISPYGYLSEVAPGPAFVGVDRPMKVYTFDNLLFTQEGNDRLTGGSGSDTFVFNATLRAGHNRDIVSDFDVAGATGLNLVLSLLGAGIIAWEHQLVRPGDLSRLNAAFFTANGIVSIVVFLGALVDRLV